MEIVHGLRSDTLKPSGGSDTSSRYRELGVSNRSISYPQPIDGYHSHIRRSICLVKERMMDHNLSRAACIITGYLFHASSVLVGAHQCYSVRDCGV